MQQTALKLVQLPIESIALSTHERSLWSRSDPPNNSHETPLPFPPVPSLHPSSLLLASLLPALSFLPLPLPLAPLRARRLRSHLSALPLRLSLFLAHSHEHERAIARVGVCARCRASLFLSHDSPPLISPLGPPRRALSQCDIANSCVSSRRADFCHAGTASISLRNLRLRSYGVTTSLRAISIIIRRYITPFTSMAKFLSCHSASRISDDAKRDRSVK